jgi:hypothetical protein
MYPRLRRSPVRRARIQDQCGRERRSSCEAVGAKRQVYAERYGEHTPAAKAMARERLGHSDYKRVIELSNPSLPDYGIDESYQLSDERHWTLKCPHCGAWTALDQEFPKKLGQEVRIILPRKNGTGYYRACPRCQGELDLDNGEWVADYPGRPVADCGQRDAGCSFTAPSVLNCGLFRRLSQTARASSAPPWAAWLFVSIMFSIVRSESTLGSTIRVPLDEPTIQEGIDSAAKGDTVLVADGVYSGPGNVNLMFNGIDIALKSERGNEHTVIDCEGKARGFFIVGPLTEATIIEGLAIVNGNSESDVMGGGGMFVGGCRPTITGCKFVECHAMGTLSGIGGGGAIIFQNSGSHLVGCWFEGNTGESLGGAIVVNTSQMVIRNCHFDSNRALGTESIGGGIAVVTTGDEIGPRISQCDLANNEAGAGGAIYATDAVIDSCTIRGNDAESGGGVFLFDCLISSSTLSGNTASLNGGGYAGGGLESLISNCVIDGNTAVASGGGLRLLDRCDVTESIIVSNSAETGGGAACSRLPSSFRSCTIASNSAAQGSGIAFLGFEPVTHFVSRSIIVGGVGSEGVSCSPMSSVTIDCTDIYDNEGGDWIDCIEHQSDTMGNLSADPGFCKAGIDWSICSDSPCAPEHSGKCGLIGALPVGCGDCGVQTVTPTTWGQIKYQARRPARVPSASE